MPRFFSSFFPPNSLYKKLFRLSCLTGPFQTALLQHFNYYKQGGVLGTANTGKHFKIFPTVSSAKTTGRSPEFSFVLLLRNFKDIIAYTGL